MEKQLGFRDQQIEKLNSKCSLLQIEYATWIESKRLPKAREEETTENKPDEAKEETAPKCDMKTTGTVTDVQPLPESAVVVQQQPTTVDINSLEANAMLIASLNNELMQLLQVGTCCFLALLRSA